MNSITAQLENTLSYYQAQSYTTQAKRAYDVLLELIAQGMFSETKIYTEEELGNILRIGRTPLREALKLLEFDAVIKIVPRLGIQMQACRLEEYLLEVEVRVALENVVMRRACLLATDSHRQQLTALNEQFAHMVKSGDNLGLYRVDCKIHAAIDESSKNPYAVRALAPLRFYEQRVHYLLSNVYPEIGLNLNRAHIAYVDAIICKQENAACKHFGDMIDETTKLVRKHVAANMGILF